MKTFSINAFPAAFAAAVILTCSVAHAEPAMVQVPVVIQQASSTASRAEVRADTAVWIAAGMEKYSSDQGALDVYTPEYQKDFATYTAVRSSPQFAMLVTDFQHGQTPRVAVSRSPLRLSIATR